MAGIERDCLELEAPPGFEPGMEVLQTVQGCIRGTPRTSGVVVLFGKSAGFAPTGLTQITGGLPPTGTEKGQRPRPNVGVIPRRLRVRPLSDHLWASLVASAHGNG